MLKRLGRGLIFVAGSVVGGLALAFLIVALRPELIRGASARGPAAACRRVPPAAAPAPAARHLRRRGRSAPRRRSSTSTPRGW